MYKLIFTASGEDVKDRYDALATFSKKDEAEKAAIEEGIEIYKKRPGEFSEGGFLYGTSTPIISVRYFDENEDQ